MDLKCLLLFLQDKMATKSNIEVLKAVFITLIGAFHVLVQLLYSGKTIRKTFF